VRRYAASIVAPLALLASAGEAGAQDADPAVTAAPRETAVTGRTVRTAAPYVAPRTRTERRLAALWSEILGVDRVGRADTFVAVGGHSLTAARLALAIERAFNVRLEPPVLLENRTLTDLAMLIDQQTAR
jgi:acyl carrier protein